MTPECWRGVEYRARIDRRCDECGGTIPAGETFTLTSRAHDPTTTIRLHDTCERWRCALKRAMAAEARHLDDGFDFGELGDALREFCIQRLGYDPRIEEAA